MSCMPDREILLRDPVHCSQLMCSPQAKVYVVSIWTFHVIFCLGEDTTLPAVKLSLH
jgi:hypothetical protein